MLRQSGTRQPAPFAVYFGDRVKEFLRLSPATPVFSELVSEHFPISVVNDKALRRASGVDTQVWLRGRRNAEVCRKEGNPQETPIRPLISGIAPTTFLRYYRYPQRDIHQLKPMTSRHCGGSAVSNMHVQTICPTHIWFLCTCSAHTWCGWRRVFS